jgi:phosphotransferase system enzyme I (PtsI)
MSKKLQGVCASPGIGVGKILLVGKEEFSVFPRKIAVSEIPAEILKFEEALIKTRRELVELQRNLSHQLGQEHAQIFDAHLLVLEDRVLIEDVIIQIKNSKSNVEYAFQQVIKKYVDTLTKLDDEYLRERAIDIQDVAKRVMRKLFKQECNLAASVTEKVVIVAHDLSPADTAALPKENILGFATNIGGRTSHTAIIARALGIPAVVGLEKITAYVNDKTQLIVDGSEGVVVINPDEETLNVYRKKQREAKRIKKLFESIKDDPAQSVDGQQVILAGNIELPEEIPLLLNAGAQGVGLFRSEFLYLGRKELPDEDEQYRAYARVVKSMAPNPVIIRTLDIGGDKFLSHPDIPPDMHPYLGWRAIRFCLGRPEVFRVQLRAILRASTHGPTKIMFPMISGVDELRQAKVVLEECKTELRAKKVAFDEDIEVGVMIEVPSAAVTSDIIAKECAFFSIGTNDLIQYSLAVDRGNEKVAYLYDPLHPGVLRLIKMTIENAHKAGIWVGMCGEMASEPMYTPLLLAMGIDELSSSPSSIAKVKYLIRSISVAESRELLEKVMQISDSKEIAKVIQKFLRARVEHFDAVLES